MTLETLNAPDMRHRVPALDGMRGLAISLVVICHCFINPAVVTPGSLPAYLQTIGLLTWSGVDLFFVLSGFLIGGILIDSRGSQSFYRSFFLRRAFRILPLYALVVGGIYLIGLVAASEPNGRLARLLTPVPPWIVFATFTQNFAIALRPSSVAEWLIPTWSLAVEEQFYLTFPLLVRLVSPARLPKLLLVLIALAPLTRVLIYAFSPLLDPEKAIYVLTPCRMEPIACGVLVAVVVRTPWCWKVVLERKPLLVVTFTGLLSIIVGFTLLRIGTTSPAMITFGYTIIAACYGLFLLLALTSPSSFGNQLLVNPVCRGVGVIAYCLYLVHYPVLTLSFYIFGTGEVRLEGWKDAGVSAASVIFSLIIATISWRYFEEPILRIGRRYSHMEKQSR